MDSPLATRSDARAKDRQPRQTFARVRPKEAGHRRFHYGAYRPVDDDDDVTFAAGSDEGAPPAALAGRIVVDTQHAKVGTVTDVVSDETEALGWAVVKTGALSGEHFMPLDNAYVDTDGRLVVRLNKTAVRHAPRVSAHHALTAQRRRELRTYYGIAA